jgi:hypothetical protein
VLRINEIMQEKGYTQKYPAERINRWLKENHNLTFTTIAKPEAEPGEPILFTYGKSVLVL